MNLTTFSVATFNLYNLNLPGGPMYRDADGWTEEEYAAKVAWTGRLLRDLAPDVVGVQELWHAEALTEVVRSAGSEGEYDLLAEPATGAKIVCGALVRSGLLVPGSARWIEDFPDDLRLESSGDDPQTPEISVGIRGFSRPVLRFEIQPREDEEAIAVYVAHLKSKAPTQLWKEDWYAAERERFQPHAKALGAALSTIRRTAEAAALRVLLTAEMKGTTTPVIVLGDLNDGHSSNTLNILTEQPRYLVGGSVGGADNGLYAGQTLQEYRDTRDVYYTHVFQDMRESLDHVLVSEQLYDHSRRRRWLFDGLVIYNDHLDEEDHKARGTGDHGIVRARFRHRPA